MAEEVSIKVPSLFGGISRQPANIRHHHQVADALNTIFSVQDGASKRPGTRLVRTLPTLLSAGDYRLHAITRDQDEQYLVVYGEGELRIFELDGTEANVQMFSAARNYFTRNDAGADQIKLVTIADYTLILNSTVPTASNADALNYAIVGVDKNSRAVFSRRADEGEHFRARSSDDEFPAGHWLYVVPDSENGWSTWQRETGLGKNWTRVNNYWYRANRNPSGFRIRFQRQGLAETGLSYDASTSKLSKAGAFDGYTFASGDEIRIEAGASMPAGFYAIAGKDDDDQIELTGDYRTLSDESETYSGGNDTVNSIGITRAYETEENFNATMASDMDEVAYRWQVSLRNTGATNALIRWSQLRESFVITSPWRGEGTEIVGMYPPDSGFDLTQGSNHPFSFGAGVVEAGFGDPPSDTLDVIERWENVPAPDQTGNILDSTTMPVQLVRESYTGDGSTPAVFSAELIDWVPRLSGDGDTNPLPSIFTENQPITDITLHRNRLAIAGDVNVVFSQAGDFFNFFLEDANNIKDSDPIDIALSSDEVTLIDYIMPFRKSLLIFTKAGRQFELNTPEALTPSTAAITPATSYRTLSVRPVSIGSMAYFLADSRGSGTVYEYYYDDSQVANAAADITSHVPGLLPPSLRTITASPNNEVLLVLPDDCNAIYAYRMFWMGTEKRQSAWSKWAFAETGRIADIAIIRNDCYMLIEDAGQWTLERMPVINRHPEVSQCPGPFTPSPGPPPEPVQILTTSLPDAVEGQPYTASLQGDGQEPFTWTIIDGSLPAGLTMSSAGEITGTPTADGLATFTVKLENSNGTSDTSELTINVIAESVELAIMTTSLPGATEGQAYSHQLLASGGTQPYTWTIDSGDLPDGLSLSSGGLISGTPTEDGDFNFTVQVEDDATDTETQELDLDVGSDSVPCSYTLDDGEDEYTVTGDPIEQVGNSTIDTSTENPWNGVLVRDGTTKWWLPSPDLTPRSFNGRRMARQNTSPLGSNHARIDLVSSGGQCYWRLLIAMRQGFNVRQWEGHKTTGQDPRGTYTCTNENSIPQTLTVED